MKATILVLAIVIITSQCAALEMTLTVDRIGAIYNESIGGGQYRVVPNQALSDAISTEGPFHSFCLEKHEPIDTTGATQYFAQINIAAVLGDGEDPLLPPADSDLLDPLTATLYWGYVNGILPNFNSLDQIDIGMLQTAIWVIEDEMQNPMVPEIIELIDWAAQQSWNDIGNVRALNLWTEEVTGEMIPAQDVLVMIPEPVTFILLAAGVIALKRQKRPAQR